MPLDELLLAVALASYALGALALIAYFFSREAWLRDVGAPLAIMGCVAQFAQLGARWQMTHVWPLLNLYGSLSLFAAMSVAIYIGFAFRYRLWLVGGFVLALAAIFLAYGVTWNEGTMPRFLRCNRIGRRFTCLSSCRRTRHFWSPSSFRPYIC